MAAILGLEDVDIMAACAEAAQGEVGVCGEFKCAGQVVIAGQKTAVDRAIEACKARGAKRALAFAGFSTFTLCADATCSRKVSIGIG